MYRLISLMLVVVFLFGCGPVKMSPGDIANEKKAVEAVVSGFWKAYEEKDLAAINKLFTSSDDLLIFGTDSAEVIKSLAQWEAQMKSEWEVYDKMKPGAMRNLSILLSTDGEMASVICEAPVTITAGGQVTNALFRENFALRKEKGAWRIVHGLAAVATVGQSSAELAAKMKAEKEKSPKK